MFQHILVPLDGSTLAEGILAHIQALSHIDSPRVTLLHIMDPSSPARPGVVDPFEWQIQKAEATTYLRGVASRIESDTLKPEIELLEGNAAESVIEYAHNVQADLIALSSHGRSGISSWNISSVVQKIILRARRSVLLVRAYQAAPVVQAELHYNRIVLPLDGSQRAEVVIPVAVELARDERAAVHVVHIVQRPEIPHRTPLSAEDLDLIARLTERKRVEAMKYMDQLKLRLGMKLETSVIEHDSVTRALHQFVEDVGADLVLFSAHGFTGETKWPYGSLPTSFINYGTTPLLIVQDMPEESIEPTMAELAARERGGR